MAYGYYPKLLKEYKNVLPWLNQTTIENWVNNFEKKRASIFVTTYVTASVTTDNFITTSFPTDNTITSSIPAYYYVSESVPTYYPISTYIPTDYTVNAYVPTEYPVSDSNVASIKKVGRPKGTTNDNKRGTEIGNANANNDITAIVYKNKT